MDKRLRSSFKGHIKKNAANGAKEQTAINTSTTTSTQIPELDCDKRLAGNCPVTPTEILSKNMSHVVLSTNSKPNNNNNNNNNNIQNHNSNTSRPPSSKAVAASPMDHMVAAAVQAKATSSRNKNEEAINDLRTRIPEIENIFDIHTRIGNGTFSTVLLGTLKKERGLQENQKRKFAIKHHIPTSHPDRIMKELQCMAKIGGSDNVVGINCCIRYNESVAFIMPYLSHDRFHDFYNKMDVAEVQFFMKNLLIALRHVHRFNVIHRDVKPSNFLYNRRRRQFLLVDFGLAQQVQQTVTSAAAAAASLCGKTASLSLPAPTASTHGTDGKRSREHDDLKKSQLSNGEATGGTAAAVTGGGEIVSGIAKRLKCSSVHSSDSGRIASSFKIPLQETNVNSPSANAPSYLGPKTAATAALPSVQQQQNQTTATEAAAAALMAGSAGDVKSAALTNRLLQKLRAQGGAERGSSTRTSSHGSKLTNGSAAATQLAANNNNNSNDAVSPAALQAQAENKYNTNRNLSSSTGPKCFCYGNPQVCNICLVKKEIHASRAGTPGYRPPEVLLKYPDQTTAVDIWAAGVIFLSVLSSVYPFFKAPNDYVALAEMVTIFGDKTIRKTAFILDRLITLSQKTKPLDLRKLCVRFRNRAKFSSAELLKKYQRPDGSCDVCKNCDQFFFNCLCAESPFVTEPTSEQDDIFPSSAYDLLEKLLEVNPHKRITANEALQHEFFQECPNNNNDNVNKNNNATTSNASNSGSNPCTSVLALSGFNKPTSCINLQSAAVGNSTKTNC